MRLKRMMLVLATIIFCCATAAAQVVGTDAQAAIRRGNEKYARAEYPAAIREYSRVQEDAGSEAYAQSLYNMGVCYFELRRNDEAVAMYRRAIEARNGQYPKALYALGVALETANRLDEAKEAYTRAVGVSEGRYTEAGLAVAHYRLALLTGRAGDYERAATLFRESIARSRGKFPAGHNNLGVMLALSGKTAEALLEFELAVQQSTGSFDEAAYNLKLCRAQLAEAALKRNAYASLKVSDSTFVLTK